MHCLVIGSSGLIGKALSDKLLKEYSKVSFFDKAISSNMDLCSEVSWELLNADMFHADFVYFLAFHVGGSKYIGEAANTLTILDENIQIMYNVFEALAYHKKPFVFASSQMSNMLHSPYGCLKRIGEHYTQALGGINVRFWNVYGKEQVGERSHVINDFIDQALHNNHIKMLTDGTEQRQFLHTDDAAVALLNLCKYYDKVDTSKYYDITSHQWTSIHEVAQIIAKETGCAITLGSRKDVSQLDMRNEPTPHMLKHWLGPKIFLEEGISNLIKDYICQEKELQSLVVVASLEQT